MLHSSFMEFKIQFCCTNADMSKYAVKMHWPIETIRCSCLIVVAFCEYQDFKVETETKPRTNKICLKACVKPSQFLEDCILSVRKWFRFDEVSFPPQFPCTWNRCPSVRGGLKLFISRRNCTAVTCM